MGWSGVSGNENGGLGAGDLGAFHNKTNHWDTVSSPCLL